MAVPCAARSENAVVPCGAAEFLLTTENTDDLAETKYGIMEDIAVPDSFRRPILVLTKAICGDLEKHAYSVNDAIADPEIRNLHVLAGV